MTIPAAPFVCPPALTDFEKEKARILSVWRDILGIPTFSSPPPLNPRTVEAAVDDGDYRRTKVCYGNTTDDVVRAWLLIPHAIDRPVPAIICLPGSFMTPNWGKDAPAGLAGPLNPGDPEAYGADLARLGYVTLCPDYPCAGERTTPGLKAYDTSALDRRHPSWTRVGLSTWDVGRAVDFLHTVPEVDPLRIGCTGWSQGGQMTVLGAAFDPRIAVVVSVCGWSPLRGLEGPLVENLVQPYNFPRLRGYIESGTPLPYDFEAVAATIAPRPFLDIRASEDRFFPNVRAMRGAAQELQKLYTLYGAGERFRMVETTGPHAYTAAAAEATRDWFHRWLRYGIG